MTDSRECRIYRFYGLDPHTGYRTKTLIYVGETVRMPFVRMLEHVYGKPWADTIVSWERDDRVFAGKAEVLAAERAAVEAEKPLYNDEYNRGNPRRVPAWKQRQQAQSRGSTARPRPLAPSGSASKRSRRGSSSPRRGRAKRARHDLDPPRWFGAALMVGVVWVAMVVALWVLRADDWQGWEAPRNSVAWSTVATVVVALAAWSKRKRRRRR